jgi:hypothetical protein
MEQGNCGEDGSLSQFGIFVGHSHILSVEGKGEYPCLHVKQDSQNSFFLELLAVGRARSIGVVSQLSQT